MISGYASVFYDGRSETEYSLGERYVERIMPGAFNNALAGDDVVGLFNHNPDNVLGRTSAGTMKLTVDQRGLRYDITESNTSIYRDVSELQSRNEVLGSSFGFIVMDEVQRRDGDTLVREITDVKLLDVGPVTFPAYSGTNQVRFVTRDGACLRVDGKAGEEARSRFTLFPKPLKYRARLLTIDKPELW